ncbi:MAG: hypothetical protein F4X32_03935 [Candidatus Dadabacteria bacterium]|nr:hypothetical protein [Candidatus Dadabacteria bacterium]MYB26642.1 hypothetical protein [Candidatus Dadabacteria bacterium]
MSDNKKINMSIFLLKEDVSPEESLKEEAMRELEDFKKIPEWKVVFKGKPPLPPDWAECLDIDVSTSTAGAVLFIKRENLWFAVCFGYGHNFLDKNEVVGDFGLRTALNALDKEKIKSSDVFSPSDHSKQRRTQTVADSSLQGHDMDGFSHILKRITGRVLEQYEGLFKTVSASSESVKISVSRNIDEWSRICSEIHDIYSGNECEENFPEVFHLRPVEDREKEDELFERLLEEINRQGEKVYLEIPELIDFQEASDFRINVKDRKKHVFSCEDLDIRSFYQIVSELGKMVELEDLRKWELILRDVNGQDRTSFWLLRCLVFECELEGGREYHFSHGRWYGINQEFSRQLKEIDGFLADEINGRDLPAYRHENENEYNRELSETLGGCCLDRKLVPMQGYDKVELCDVLLVEGDAGDRRKNMFVHVKRKHGGSSGLSHLFQQGSVSLTLLNSGDRNFLESVKNLKGDFNEFLPAVVHYLIVGDKPNDSIPLFTRISLFKTIREIRSKGGEIRWSVVDPS